MFVVLLCRCSFLSFWTIILENTNFVCGENLFTDLIVILTLFNTFFPFVKSLVPECTIGASIEQVIFLCNVVSDAFRQHWFDDIPMQYCELLGQHCTGLLPMQCCPNSIKTSNRIFLIQCCLKPQGQLYIRFFLCNVVPEDHTSRTILHR